MGRFTEGTNFFSFLAHEDTEEYDMGVAALLQKYVFSCPDASKRQRVIECGNIRGTTLLHHFAEESMRHCVEALLLNGAPVNALSSNLRRVVEGDTEFKVSWYETPLDRAVEEKQRRRSELNMDSQFTLQLNEERCRKSDVITSMLEKAGGLRKSEEKRRKPFVFDGRRDGSFVWRNALRDA